MPSARRRHGFAPRIVIKDSRMNPGSELLRDFERELRRDFSGDIRMDRFTRVLYATDASIYEIEPLGVLLPRCHADVAAAVSAAARLGIPLLARGGGTSLAGQTVGAAVILDFSRHMNRILGFDPEERSARVEPGVVLDQLNAHLAPAGWMFGPDVSTANRATLGGMVGNNSSGSRSIIHGKTIDHVREMRALLSSGLDTSLRELGSEEWRGKTALAGTEGDLYRALDRIVSAAAGEIATRYPRVMRRVGGYNLDSFVDTSRRNLCRMIAGSEGTLAIFTEVLVNLVPAPRHKGLCVVHFDDLTAALEATAEILPLGPAAVELIDKMILDLTRRQAAFARRLTFVEGDPAAILLVEFHGNSPAEVQGRLDSLERCLRAHSRGTAFVRSEDAAEQARIWAVRKAGLGMLSSMRGDAKPVAFIEDTAVEPADLARYVGRLQEILATHGTRAGCYGHASAGCLHIRPILNLKSAEGVRRMTEIAAAVKDLVVEFGGAMSGEHGDGLSRSHWNRELFGEEIYRAFKDVKQAFDPIGIMNPGKIVDAPPMDRNLRYGPEYAAAAIATHLDFSLEGGFARAVEQCNGLGACRKSGSGTMCPSYLATREEEHSTRGRANALRAALSGKLPLQSLAAPRLHAALDLCLECKACKTECPANVDMAKVKYEFLAHYHAHHGTPLRARLFGRIASLSRAASATAPLSNWLLRSALARHTLQRALGIHPARRLPLFARETFAAWLRRHPVPRREGKVKVVLFNDTFANYNEPDVARAALRLLLESGAEVMVPEVVCCGRPMISRGLLDDARENARRNVEILAAPARAGAFIVGCEPSCILTLREEYPDLLRSEDSRTVAGQVMLLEEFLARQVDEGGWKPSFTDSPRSVLVHGHCHQKSLAGEAPALRLLRLPAGYRVQEVASGCCGMAGAFGYEKEHYEISLQIGELSLFPAIRSADPGTEIVASGTSCRQQILHATRKRAHHFAETLVRALPQ